MSASERTSHPALPELTADLKVEALSLGFDAVGITTSEPSAHEVLYRRWIDRGLHGDMAYLAREDAVRRRFALEETLPGVRSVVVVAHHYPPDDPPGIPDDPSRGVIARYARGRDYHKVVKGKLRRLSRWLGEEVRGKVEGETPSENAAAPLTHHVYVDTGPLLERDLARRAGLGWFGKNTMLIHPERGSYFFLGVLLTTVELEPDAPFEADRCGTCTACLDACPTDALLGRDESGAPVMDARLCISYLTIEHRGAVPAELRPAMGNRIYGCDICQEVCPWNRRFAAPGAEPDYAARPAWDGPALVDLLRLSEEEWDVYTRGSALRRAGYAGLRRNVEIALGNLPRGE